MIKQQYPEFEPAPASEAADVFGAGFGFKEGDFDINAAFQAAFVDVATDQSSDLDDKISKISNMLREATSPVYQNFVDFRQLANQIQFYCNHDHNFANALGKHEDIGSFLDTNKDHQHESTDAKKNSEKKEDDEKSKAKKKKKKRSFGDWFLQLSGVKEN